MKLNKTKIEWCSHSWNPVTGCYHACDFCYARRIADRFKPHGIERPLNPEAIQTTEIQTTGKRYHIITEPVKISDGAGGPARDCKYPHGFEPTLHRYRLDNPQEQLTPATIFVCSMADLFGEWVPDEWIEEVFEACRKAPQHIYLFLTKNPRRYLSLAYAGKLPRDDNFWYGSTATGPHKPIFWGDGFHTFVSYEPVLEDFGGPEKADSGAPASTDWAIIGAETGSKKSKVVPKREWVEGIVKSYHDLGKPVFMKDSMIPIWGEDIPRERPAAMEGR